MKRRQFLQPANQNKMLAVCVSAKHVVASHSFLTIDMSSLDIHILWVKYNTITCVGLVKYVVLG